MNDNTSRGFLPFAVIVAALGISGCGSPSQVDLPSPAHAPSAISRSDVPVLRVLTAGKTPGMPLGSGPQDIVYGPDGAMWFTDEFPAIGKVTPSKRVVEYTTGLISKSRPLSIVAGPDANLWFSDAQGAIGRITTSGAITEFSIDRFSKIASPAGIAVAGGAIWSIAPGPPNFLVRSDLNGKLSALETPSDLYPDGSLAADWKGNLWMMTLKKANCVLLERKTDGAFVQYATGLVHGATIGSPNLAAKRIAIGPNGRPWFTNLYCLSPTAGGHVIGEKTAAGITLFKVDKTGLDHPADPSGITSNRVGIWFTGDDALQVNGALWHIDGNGAQKAYSIPHNPIGLAPDKSGNLWITAGAFGLPGQIVEASFPQ